MSRCSFGEGLKWLDFLRLYILDGVFCVVLIMYVVSEGSSEMKQKYVCMYSMYVYFIIQTFIILLEYNHYYKKEYQISMFFFIIFFQYLYFTKKNMSQINILNIYVRRSSKPDIFFTKSMKWNRLSLMMLYSSNHYLYILILASSKHDSP